MIKSIVIQNFQSHKQSELEFDKGVNIIVGPSDSGKTAIIRALRWLIWNRPSGDSMRSNWGGVTKVIVDTDDAIITRLKDKDNKYILGDSHFDAVKTDVPEEVSNVLNMDDINIQRQLDSPFLLSETSGEVARHFNRIARLDKIDTGLQNINRWIAQIAKILEFKRGERERYKEQLKQYDHLEKFEADIEVAEAMEEQRNSISRSVASIKRLLTSYEQIEEEIEQQKLLTNLEPQVNKILKLYTTLKTTTLEYGLLNTTIQRYGRTTGQIAGLARKTLLESRVNKILTLYEQLETVNNGRNMLFKAMSKLNNVTTLLNKETVLFSSKTLEFENNMPPVCPLCGTNLKNKKQ